MKRKVCGFVVLQVRVFDDKHIVVADCGNRWAW
jgi:hypothetical protein